MIKVAQYIKFDHETPKEVMSDHIKPIAGRKIDETRRYRLWFRDLKFGQESDDLIRNLITVVITQTALRTARVFYSAPKGRLKHKRKWYRRPFMIRKRKNKNEPPRLYYPGTGIKANRMYKKYHAA